MPDKHGLGRSKTSTRALVERGIQKLKPGPNLMYDIQHKKIIG